MYFTMMNNHSIFLSVVLSLALIATVASTGHSAPEVVKSRSVDVSPVDYVDTTSNDPDNEFPLLGYVSIPQSAIDDESMQLPAVVIVPVSTSLWL